MSVEACKYECKTCNLEFSRKDNLRRHNLRHLEESGSQESNQFEKLTENYSSDQVAAKSIEAEKLDASNTCDDRLGEHSQEMLLSKANALDPGFIATAAVAAAPSRESVIKSVSRSTICNRISVIKDGRREFAKVCSSEVDVRVQSAVQLVPPQSYPCPVIESPSVLSECSNQSQRNPSQPSGFVQNNIRDRMPMTRHCPIPKKKMVASYMNELYADSLAANANAGSDSPTTPNFVQPNSSRCFKYCDNNLLDLSMKSQGESCY